jgi:hypothetical protein
MSSINGNVTYGEYFDLNGHCKGSSWGFAFWELMRRKTSREKYCMDLDLGKFLKVSSRNIEDFGHMYVLI